MGNDLINLEFLLGKNVDGTTKYEKPSEQLTEEIWKRILKKLTFLLLKEQKKKRIKGLLSCYGIPSSILRVREYGGLDKGTRVSYEIKRRFTRRLGATGQFIKTNWNLSGSGLFDSLTPDTLEV